MPQASTTFDVTEFADELAKAPENRVVGTTLLFENERVRVWELALVPGQRAPFHIHSIDYFWVAADPGPVVQRVSDGTITEVVHDRNQVKYFTFRNGETLVHDLENIGDAPIRYITVELLDDDDISTRPHVHDA
ncbi:hypothetical protein AB0O34_11620 [Sphaerisporangium sp. NPDC088356]|uniref:hypothetical protein n=1 Tax=Sphaerisporangium sp. NPDC088356 TaxID=3154871 RepID=UPI00341A1335